MKRTFQIAALSILSFSLTALGVPAQAAAADFHAERGRTQAAHVQPVSWHRDDGRRDDHRDYRDDNRDDGRYYAAPYRDSSGHAGRDIAIVGGSAAAGALIGAAAGQGQGAVIGGILGGVTGLIVDQAAVHHR